MSEIRKWTTDRELLLAGEFDGRFVRPVSGQVANHPFTAEGGCATCCSAFPGCAAKIATPK
jgi:hypothetical protein